MEELFVTYLKERLPLVEGALADAAAAPLTDGAARGDLDRYLYGPLERFTASGGKRVRPVLALLGAEAVGGRAEDALSCAVAVELFQSAALIHDDIADEGELRRGEPCLHRVEGEGLAINAGDLALTQVFEVLLADEGLVAERKVRVMGEIARMERHTLEGQALDLGWVRDGRWDLTTDDYLYMVRSKTAWYSAAVPLYVGALAAGQDDLLNLVGDAAAQGKDFRSDVTEGKRTLAVVWALEHLDAADRAELVALLDAHPTAPTDLERAVRLIELGGGIERCRELARELAADAKRQADALLEAGHISVEARDLLVSMADFFVERAG